MMRLLLNGLGASAGSGLTYLYNVVPLLASRTDVRTILLVQPELRKHFEQFPLLGLPCVDVPRSATRRFVFEQRELARLLREYQADVLLSAGNFALRKSPVPQILLSGNSLYTSAEFRQDLRRRREYRMLVENELRSLMAHRSIKWADVTVAPSQAFANRLSRWSGKKVGVIHHGFDGQLFFDSRAELPPEIGRILAECQGCLKLLYVSHYNYYRNFETLLRALPLIRDRIKPRRVRLLLTCRLRDGANPGNYKTKEVAGLVKSLGIRDEVAELGAVPYQLVHHLYRACDVYVTPAYTETFAHPLVEAMASGVPVVASDLPVHREIAGSAALYFRTFSSDALAENVLRLASSGDFAKSLVKSGRTRAMEFSWGKHVAELLKLVPSISGKQRAVSASAA